MSAPTAGEILDLVPQRRPMRFVDEILEVDEEHISAVYTWKEEDCAGHFPGNPVVPGVKLIEMAAQTGNVAWGIYHMLLKANAAAIRNSVGFFTAIDQGTFKKMVRPGETVLAEAGFGEEGYFRGNKIRAEVEIRFRGGPKDGETVFQGISSGLWVAKDSPGYHEF